jgi:signal transduction histidine kinase
VRIEFIPPSQDLPPLTPEWKTAIYRIVQEALNNAIKHSGSHQVRIALEHDGQRIRLEVRDWGIGFTAKPPSRGVHGLRGLKERVRLLNGTFKLHSAPNEGTTLEIELPLAAPGPAQGS